MSYSDFQSKAASEKIALVVLEASRRLVGWTLYSGSVYQLTEFTHQVITSIADSGVALAAASSTSLSAGQFYHDREAAVLYLRTSDSVNPNSKFLALTFKNFYANAPCSLAHDLASGYRVEWLPYLRQNSSFGVELDSKSQMGFAIEGAGKVSFVNDQDYWKPIFDKWTFENQLVNVYSWSRSLAATEAKRIYRGRIQAKEYSTEQVSFSLKDLINELRAPVALSDLSGVSGALLPPSMQTAKQRRLYGYVRGNRPTSIDQELPLTGYTITGTVSVTASSVTVTGSGTSFLAQVTPGDELIFGSDTDKRTVSAVASDTSLTLTEAYDGTTGSGKAIKLFSSHGKRYMNRTFLLAGHSLKEPSTTVTSAVTTSLFQVASTTDFEAGDSILISGEVLVVSRVAGGYIKTTTGLALTPSVGATVSRLTVSNVYVNNRLLTYSRDYSYNATTARLTLTQLAEFYVAPTRTITGTISFTSTSRTATGTGTVFSSEVKPGDWIKRSSQSDWFEVLSVESNTSLTLRTAATYTSSGASDHKKPEIVNNEEVILSCDVLGATENGTPTGTFIKTAAQIVKDLLTAGGLSSVLNTASFTVAQGDSKHKIGMAIPEKFKDTKTPTLRDAINKINQSVFGSLYQNEDFELEYAIFSPKRALSTTTRFSESDVLDFKVQSDSSRIVKTVRIKYLKKEYDSASLTDSVSAEVTKDSRSATYLAGSTKEQVIETLLVDSGQAQILANRWSFLLEIAASVVTIDTKMQGARIAVNDRVELSHEKLYERIGSTLTRKVSGVQAARKSASDSSLEIEDLSNAFSRCAVITPSTASEYNEASDDEKLYNGYITDQYGMIDNAPGTFGANLIW